jgi:hypothetical protein
MTFTFFSILSPSGKTALCDWLGLFLFSGGGEHAKAKTKSTTMRSHLFLLKQFCISLRLTNPFPDLGNGRTLAVHKHPDAINPGGKPHKTGDRQTVY